MKDAPTPQCLSLLCLGIQKPVCRVPFSCELNCLSSREVSPSIYNNITCLHHLSSPPPLFLHSRMSSTTSSAQSPVRVSSTTSSKGSSSKSGSTPGTQKHPSQVGRRNARERNRVRQVNMGFVTLRNHIPNQAKNKKLSKVETLRQAAVYIEHLRRILESNAGEGGASFYSSQQSSCFSGLGESIAELFSAYSPAPSTPSSGVGYQPNGGYPQTPTYTSENFNPSIPMGSQNYHHMNMFPDSQTVSSGLQQQQQLNNFADYAHCYPNGPGNGAQYPTPNSHGFGMMNQEHLKMAPDTSDPSPSSSFVSDNSFDMPLTPEHKYSHSTDFIAPFP